MAQTPLFTITRRYIPEMPGAGRLGRHFRWDSRSAAFPYLRTPGRVPVTTRWPRHVPLFDQGEVGSCTGEAEAGAVGTGPLWDALGPGVRATIGQHLAVTLYSAAESIDGDGPYPPQDHGSSGMSVCQAAKAAGLIAGYRHVTDGVGGLADALQSGPAIMGSNWYTSMDTPDPSGLVGVTRGATVRGGHEYLIRGVDMENEEFEADNSWGTGWGLGGSFRLPFALVNRLLQEEGDATVSVPVTAPAPVPHPNPPQPAPVPAVFPADLDFVRAMAVWDASYHTGHNAEAQRFYRSWKIARGITTASVEPGDYIS